jgi:hypothetical protein
MSHDYLSPRLRVTVPLLKIVGTVISRSLISEELLCLGRDIRASDAQRYIVTSFNHILWKLDDNGKRWGFR